MVRNLIKRIYYKIKEVLIFYKEYFSKRVGKKVKIKNLEREMLLIAHSIEKGMGLPKVRKGYGREKVKKLISLIKDYRDKDYERNAFVYLESIKSLQIWLEFQENIEVDVTDIYKDYTEIIKNESDSFLEILSLYKFGTNFIKLEDLEQIKNFEFEKFLISRHSIRDFEDEIVDEETLKKVIELSNRAPSACNRQPVRVYCTSNKKHVSIVDNLITGTNGFKGHVPNFAVITCQRAYFSEQETFQWYVNGGIFLGYFVLALHSFGIGSCIMQWFPFHKNEKKIKELFGIDKSEAIIAVVGYGKIKKDSKIIEAYRKSINDTLIIIKEDD